MHAVKIKTRMEKTIDIDKLRALNEAKSELSVVLARAMCKGIGREDIHALVDQIYDHYEDR